MSQWFATRRRHNLVSIILDKLCARELISLSKLARMVGVSPSYVSHIRTGNRRPSYEMAMEMVRTWPFTQNEAVDFCAHFGYIAPGAHVNGITPGREIDRKRALILAAHGNAIRQRKETTT